MMSTGTIVDIRSPGNYLFQTSQGDAWSYRSSRTYRLGDIIYTTAYVNTTSASDMGSDFFVFT